MRSFEFRERVFPGISRAGSPLLMEITNMRWTTVRTWFCCCRCHRIVFGAIHLASLTDPVDRCDRESVGAYQREEDPESRQAQGYRSGDYHRVDWRSVLPPIQQSPPGGE